MRQWAVADSVLRQGRLKVNRPIEFHFSVRRGKNRACEHWHIIFLLTDDGPIDISEYMEKFAVQDWLAHLGICGDEEGTIDEQ